MKVNILTSGFAGGFTDDFIAALKPYFHGGKFVFAASEFTEKGKEKTMRHVNFFLNSFAENGVTFSGVTVIDYEISKEQAHKEIAEAGLVWLSGGNTLKEMEYYREYELAEALQKYDGVIVGMSAGSINMAKRVVLARDDDDAIPRLFVYEGLGLVEINIEPHVNNCTEKHWQEIFDASRLAPIYCLPDESFIVEKNGSLELCGPIQIAYQGEFLNK